jgi:O-6-methylguanine DNA methyltransferase
MLAGLRALRSRAPERLLGAVLAEAAPHDEYAALETRFGPVLVAWNERGVSMTAPASMADEAFVAAFRKRFARSLSVAREVPERLARAINGRLERGRRVDLAVDLAGRSEFERAVLDKALEIPPGEVRPYAWIAREIGRPRAVRAVGSALARNPVPLVLPCHRVVRSDGVIGDYAWGTDAKVSFLREEGVDTAELQRLARSGVRFVGSDTTRVYCLPTCHNARRITERHRVALPSEQAAVALSMRPCRSCRPAAIAA